MFAASRSVIAHSSIKSDSRMNSAIDLFADKLSTIEHGKPANLFRKIALGCKSPLLKYGTYNGHKKILGHLCNT